MRNKLLIFLTALMLSCASVGLLTACGHTHEYSKVVTNPTCLEKGYTTYTCECGDSYVADEVAALGHAYGSEWVSQGNGTHAQICANDSNHKKTQNCSGGTATCASEAECSVCNGKYGEKLPHAWSAWASVGDNTHKRVCANDETHVEIVECGGGNATCDNKAVCTTCNTEYGEKLGHNWSAWVSVGDDTHKRVCENDETHVEIVECSGGNATCDNKAVCATCNTEYGEKLDCAYPDVWTSIGEGKHQKVCANNEAHVLIEDCVFNKEVAEAKYLKTEATATSKAQYFYSCECGACGEETFKYGEFAEVTNYDASTGELYTSVLNGKEIVSATFGDVELTEANGGIINNDGKYTFRSKTSNTDELAGVPFFTAPTTDNVISATIVTTDGTIEIKYVAVWNVIIDDQQEFLQTLDNNVFGDGETTHVIIRKNIALANDLDMTGYAFENGLGTKFSGYFEGNGYVVSNLQVRGYKYSSTRYIGIFGRVEGGAVIKNIAFANLMCTGGYTGNLTSPFAFKLEANSKVENIYIQADANILNRFTSVGPQADHRAKIKNFVIDFPAADQVIDEAWLKAGTTYSGKGSAFPDAVNIIPNGTANIDNMYVISKYPLLYRRKNSGTVNINSLGESVDYFAYGENETKVHFNFTYFATQLGEGVEPTVQNTQVIDPTTGKQVTDIKASKTFVLENIRRYDDMDAFAADTDSKHLENLKEMEETGMWKVVEGKLYWAKLAPQA